MQRPHPARASSHRIVLICGIAPALLTVVLALYRPAFLAQLDYRVYDTMLRSSRSSTPSPPDGRVAIVDVDDRSLSRIGQWPWRRDLIARLISRIRSLGASVVAIDVVFPEADRWDASSGQAAPDIVLEDTLRAGRVVLGYALTFDGPGSRPDACVLHSLELPLQQTAGGDGGPPLFRATGVVCSLPALARAAGASGFLNAVPDTDGVLRRVPLLAEYDGRVYPGLALAALLAATNTRVIALRAANVNASSLMLGGRVVPLDGRSNLLLRYRGGNRTFPRVSAADVLDEAAPAGIFRDAIVFIGSTALGAREVVSTPFDRLFAGVEVQATVADNLLRQDFISRPEDASTLEAMTVLIVGIAIALLVLRLGLTLGSVAGALLLPVLWLGALWLLAANGQYLSPLFPAIALMASLATATIARLRYERGRADWAANEKDLAQRLMVQSLLSLTEMRDAETGRHSRRTRQYAKLLAEQLADDPRFRHYLTPGRIDLLASLAPLHDIGKVGVPDQLLNKPGKLTPEEFEEMKKHPVYGLDVINRAEQDAGAGGDLTLALAKDIVYTHHERWDGGGYPRGLKGEQIPIAGRLMALVDVYDALTTRRLYRDPMPHEKAVELIVDGTGTHFDPAVVGAFMRIAPLVCHISDEIAGTAPAANVARQGAFS